VDTIIDFAEYWPVTSVWARYQEEVKAFSSDDMSVLYLHTLPIPGIFKEQEGEGEAKEELIGEHPTRTARPVRRVVFRVESRDQGWSSNVGCGMFSVRRSYNGEMANASILGIYSGGFTWFEAAAERPTSVDAISRAQRLEQPVPLSGMPELPEQQNTAWKPVTVTRRIFDSATKSLKLEVKDIWKLQRNVHAGGNWKSHEIVWTCDDPEKNLEGEYLEGTDENGAGRGGDFVRSLESGDRIKLIARAIVSFPKKPSDLHLLTE
jgi:hypothetical protein